jgi:3-methylcrotonyl-CoA carboxylase beta subunit
MARIDLEKSKNQDEMQLQLSRLQHRLQKIYLGGGEKKLRNNTIRAR